MAHAGQMTSTEAMALLERGESLADIPAEPVRG
jgi:hypothetical protein